MAQSPSVYLVEKIKALDKVIAWFLEKQGKLYRSTKEKLMVFLAQIDFWDWEMDNLIYSHESFKERSQAWESTSSLCDLLSKNGMLVKNSLMKDVDWNRNVREWRHMGQETIAPVDVLNKTIRKWNELLDQCEEKVMLSENQLESFANLNAQYLTNLDKYRKQSLGVDNATR